VERELDLLHLAASLRQDDFIVSQFVAIGIEAVACNSIQPIASELMEGGPAEERVQRVGKIKQLIEALLDDRLARQGLQRSLRVERMMQMEQCRQRAQSAWVIRPLGGREIVRTLTMFELAGEAALCEEAQSANKVLARRKVQKMDWAVPTGALRLFPALTPRYSRWFQIDSFTPDVFIERQFRVIAERRLTAMDLACQLYRREKGEWPEKLEQLVPRFAKDVAKDPFHADGRSIGYRLIENGLPGRADRPVLWFDPGGADLGLRSVAMYGWFSNPPARATEERVRQYRDLTRYVTEK
jgi:hypothetical protein